MRAKRGKLWSQDPLSTVLHWIPKNKFSQERSFFEACSVELKMSVCYHSIDIRDICGQARTGPNWPEQTCSSELDIFIEHTNWPDLVVSSLRKRFSLHSVPRKDEFSLFFFTFSRITQELLNTSEN